MTGSKKYLLTLLLSVLTLYASARTETNASLPKMRTMLMLNAGISAQRQPALGFTVARTGNFGYYANFMIGLDNLHLNYDYRIDNFYCLTDGLYAGVIPFYSGKRAYNRLSATVGGMARMVIPLYIYAGAGYGYRTETWELMNKQWVQTASSLGHSAVVDTGLMGQIGNFTLLAGYTLFIGQQNRLYHEAKVGIGYTLDK